MWFNVEWEVSTLRIEQSSSSKELSWLQFVVHFAVQSLAKIANGWVFIKFLLQMFKTNYSDRERYKTFIVQIPCRKMKIFYVCLNDFGKDCFLRDLKVLINIVFAYLPCILSAWEISLPANFHLAAFIPVNISSRYMTTNFCSYVTAI